ncbi:unnamed protein product [Paramecium octaurelia]|uniref:Uncharacterized protein n=1 Tax=Paramecium octaurelia TaxID=43137 RepID=A0A8S1SJS7_PAROT|nr:unnamed protein product [Paramecium octaurelia]
MLNISYIICKNKFLLYKLCQKQFLFAPYYFPYLQDTLENLINNFIIIRPERLTVPFFEFENVGEKDYHLSSKEAQHWAKITAELDNTFIKHQSQIEANSKYTSGVVGDVVDLSKNVGVYSYTVTDINGNILETKAGDHLAQQFNPAYIKITSKIQDSTSLNIQDNNQP